MGVVIGLDMGTTACKAVALDGEGRVVATGTAGYPLHAPQSGWAEQEPAEVWAGAAAALRAATVQLAGSAIQAVSLSGAMHSLLLLDAADRPLGPALTWADQRAASEVAGLRAAADPMAVYHRTGCPLQAIYHPAKLRWCHAHRGGAFARVISLKEFVLHQLAGAWAVDMEIASATGLVDIWQRTWDEQALALAGINASALSTLVAPATVVGAVSAPAAALTGLPAGIPVAVGGSDGGMAMLGAGGNIVITVGTSGAIRRLVAAPLLDPLAQTWCYVQDAESWLAGGAINNGGLVAQWAREKFYPDDSFEKMLDEAAVIPPGAGGVIFLPYLSGERSPHWNPWERAVIAGLGLEHGRGHIARAALEGVAYCLAEVWALVGGAESARLTGGIVRAPVWCQIVCDVLGVPLELIEAADASALGAARLGFAALNLPAPPTPEPEETLNPDPSRHALYATFYAEFQNRYRENFGDEGGDSKRE